MRLLACSILLALTACDDGAPADPPADRGVDAGGVDRGLALDLGPDAAPDAGAVDHGPDAATDAAPPDAALPVGCAIRPSPREAPAWRVSGCDWVTEGDGVRLPRALVVSGDSLIRNARTPLHTALEYRQIAALGIDWVWLLVTWDGIAPRLDTFNGAYLGRICEQIAFADAAGLKVVLAMHQERWGVALGGHGAPDWATAVELAPVPAGTAEHPSLDAAWAGFWRTPDGPAALRTAWNRLLDTCAETPGVIGIQPLADPRGAPADLSPWVAQIRTDAEARFGPLLLFVDGEHPGGEAPDTVWAPTAWAGRGPSADAPDLAGVRSRAQALGLPLFVRGIALTDPALSAVEAQGAGWAGWHDGFGADPLALRDADGVIGPGGALIRERIWPLVVAGSVERFGPLPGGFQMRWRPDGRNAGLSVLRLAPPFSSAELIGGGPVDFAEWDAQAQTLSVFVQDARAAPVELRVTR